MVVKSTSKNANKNLFNLYLYFYKKIIMLYLLLITFYMYVFQYLIFYRLSPNIIKAILYKSCYIDSSEISNYKQFFIEYSFFWNIVETTADLIDILCNINIKLYNILSNDQCLI